MLVFDVLKVKKFSWLLRIASAKNIWVLYPVSFGTFKMNQFWVNGLNSEKLVKFRPEWQQ